MLVVALLTFGQPALADAEADYQEGLTAYRATDLVGSMTPLKRAADAGHARAQALYGTILDSAEFDDEAVIYLRKSAEQNDPEGQFALAKMYMTGEGVAVDNSEANRLIRAAAAQGHDRAVITLALAYVARDARLGAETQTDPEAAELLVKAAELGEVAAMEALAKAYREGGFGIAPDAAKAADWTAKLAAIRGQSSRPGGRR
jgi:hypothetical protein